MRTNRFTLALIATLTLQLCVAIADSPEEMVEKAVTKFRSGDRSDLLCSRFKDAEKSAAAFLKHVPSFAKDSEQVELVAFAVALLPAGHSDTNAPSADRTFIAERLVAIVETDKSSTLRSMAADRLQVLFSPQFLDAYAKSIRNAARHWKQEEIFVLLGMLPSCNKEDMQIILDAIAAEEPGYYSLDGILARHGDVEAEKRLMEAAMVVSETGGGRVYRLVTPLSQARTEKMKVFLANGLRCEDILAMPGGSYMPRREVFASALVKMMRGDPTFPVKVEPYFSYTSEELDKIEQWCKEQLGIKIPSTPMKSRAKLFSEVPKQTGVE